MKNILLSRIPKLSLGLTDVKKVLNFCPRFATDGEQCAGHSPSSIVTTIFWFLLKWWLLSPPPHFGYSARPDPGLIPLANNSCHRQRKRFPHISHSARDSRNTLYTAFALKEVLVQWKSSGEMHWWLQATVLSPNYNAAHSATSPFPLSLASPGAGPVSLTACWTSLGEPTPTGPSVSKNWKPCFPQIWPNHLAPCII